VSENLSNFWWRLKLIAPIELEESLIWKLDNLCIKSFSIEIKEDNKSQLILFVWLFSDEWNETARYDLVNSLVPLAKTFGFHLLKPSWEKITQEDWSSSWKKLWGPDPVGENLLILPAWLEQPKLFSKRLVLKIDPGTAFGTGSHPTTRLCLEALERNPPYGLKVADIGCGSGILSIAALNLGARFSIAVDIDSLAVRSTKENAALNDLKEEQLKVLLGSVEEASNYLKGEKVDLLVCNILATVIKGLIPQFEQVISEKGNVLLSGLLTNQVEDITRLLTEYRWQLLDVYSHKNWALIHARKGQAHSWKP